MKTNGNIRVSIRSNDALFSYLLNVLLNRESQAYLVISNPVDGECCGVIPIDHDTGQESRSTFVESDHCRLTLIAYLRAGVTRSNAAEEDVAIDLDAILPDADTPLTAPAKAGVDRGALRACERYLELLVDLLSQLPTRRFLVSVVAERGIVVRARLSPLVSHPAGTLFCQLLDQLTFYTNFPIDDHTGDALTDIELGRRADDSVLQLQRLLFTRWPSLRTLALTNCASLRNRAKLTEALSSLTLEDFERLACTQLRLVRMEDCEAHGSDFVREILVSHFAMRTTPRAAIAAMPLYPTETLLWDDKQIPSTHYAGDAPLALPKLNLQFLTFWDYLLRNFNLFRLEATYEIREDVTDNLKVHPLPVLGDQFMPAITVSSLIPS
jgi:Intron-binding protein aquarius N-terminus